MVNVNIIMLQYLITWIYVSSCLNEVIRLKSFKKVVLVLLYLFNITSFVYIVTISPFEYPKITFVIL